MARRSNVEEEERQASEREPKVVDIEIDPGRRRFLATRNLRCYARIQLSNKSHLPNLHLYLATPFRTIWTTSIWTDLFHR